MAGLRHPHSQFVWQRHPFFEHPQEQVAQSHVPQQVVFAAVSSGEFFRVDIVFSLFPSAPPAPSERLTCPRKPYRVCDGRPLFAGSNSHARTLP